MAQLWWYLRRGVAWPALLGCCAAAVVLTGAVSLWPSSAAVLLPAALACCAAAACFVYDERAGAVVAVTPRGAGWRRTARLAVVVLPLLVWAGIVLARPGDLPLHRSGWWLAGGATVVLTSGLAARASRRAVDAPGSVLASVAVLAVLSPVVVSGFLGWDSVYPASGFTTGTWAFWLVVASGGVVAWVVAARPGPSA
jgi:hypothetical protein